MPVEYSNAVENFSFPSILRRLLLMHRRPTDSVQGDNKPQTCLLQPRSGSFRLLPHFLGIIYLSSCEAVAGDPEPNGQTWSCCFHPLLSSNDSSWAQVLRSYFNDPAGPLLPRADNGGSAAKSGGAEERHGGNSDKGTLPLSPCPFSWGRWRPSVEEVDGLVLEADQRPQRLQPSGSYALRPAASRPLWRRTCPSECGT